MIIVLFLSNLSAFAPAARSAEAPAVEWYRTFGGIDEESMFLGSRSVIETSDGGYALVGRISVSPSAVLFVKADAAGNMQWNRTYGRQQQPNGDLASSVIQTSDGGYVLAGASWNQARGAHDLFLVKTDSSGNMQWNLTYIRDASGGSLDWGHAFSVIQTNDGGYMVGAGVRHHPDHPTGDWDGWLVKTDANGTVQWDKPYGGSSDEGVHEVLQASDGGYIFVGTTLSYGSGSGDVWLVKTDGSGNQQWAKTFGGSNWDDGNSIAKTSDGGYIIGAATSSFGAGSWDFWLVKTDVNGNQQWTETFGGANEDRAWSVIETINGCHALAGSTKSFGAGDSDFWVVETDSLGNQEWNRTFGGANYDDARSIVQTVDKGYAVAGYTNSFGAGSYDFLLVKLAGTEPRTWVVDDDSPADFHTIQEAINAASAGDTVFVKIGTYYEHLIVNQSLTLIGENRNLTVVDGSGNGEIVDIQANDVYIGNFTLQNAGIGAYGAVWVQGYSNAVICNNTMIDNHHGVCVWTGALNATISGNLIYNRQPSYADGIRLGLSSGNLVTGNTVINESTGIGLDWTSNNIVRNNIVVNNYIGIGAGNPSYENVFSENTIANNSYGFLIAIYNSKFLHNNIINNSVQAAFYGQYSNAWNNSCEGNCWSDYSGTDSDGDGIGDTPYIIDSNNIDHYPLMNLYWNPADINHDLKVNLKDVFATAKAYGSVPGDSKWNPHCDIIADAIIDLKDYFAVCKSFGRAYS